MIKAVVIDGAIYSVINGVLKYDHCREAPRKNIAGEEAEEKSLLNSDAYKKFVESRCDAFVWLNQITNIRHIKFQDMSVLSRAFAKIGNIKIYREFYRRRKSCYFWINNNLDKIQRSLKYHTLKLILKGEEEPVIIYPPKEESLDDIDLIIEESQMQVIDFDSNDLYDYYS